MNISNLNIRNAIRWIVGALLFVVVVDLIMVIFFNEILDRYFTGYTAAVVPLLIIATYSYLGLPIFSFNEDSQMLKIKSHLALGEFFGKELLINKKNIVKLSIDRERIRKKLRIHFLDAGMERVETFSITLLDNEKVRKLAQKVELIESEVKGSGSQHMFI
jgi:hypothetical protein